MQNGKLSEGQPFRYDRLDYAKRLLDLDKARLELLNLKLRLLEIATRGEKLLEYFHTHYLSRQEVLFKLPLNVSIDTTSALVIERTMQLLGRKVIVNDISAGQDDSAMLPLAGREGLTFVAMHRGGFFQRGEVADFFRNWRLKAEDLGVTDWILDPGFGFGKDIAQNWELLVNLRELKALGRPVLVGVSMKRMTCASAYVTEKAHLCALEGGADILRVHNVAAAKATARRFHSPSMM